MKVQSDGHETEGWSETGRNDILIDVMIYIMEMGVAKDIAWRKCQIISNG